MIPTADMQEQLHIVATGHTWKYISYWGMRRTPAQLTWQQKIVIKLMRPCPLSPAVCGMYALLCSILIFSDFSMSAVFRILHFLTRFLNPV